MTFGSVLFAEACQIIIIHVPPLRVMSLPAKARQRNFSQKTPSVGSALLFLCRQKRNVNLSQLNFNNFVSTIVHVEILDFSALSLEKNNLWIYILL